VCGESAALALGELDNHLFVFGAIAGSEDHVVALFIKGFYHLIADTVVAARDHYVFGFLHGWI
jgi:hypothetical protein